MNKYSYRDVIQTEKMMRYNPNPKFTPKRSQKLKNKRFAKKR